MPCQLACAACLLAAFAFAFASAPGVPEPPEPPGRAAPPQPVRTVEQLIADLGDDDYRTRERAGRDLLARGPAVAPAVRGAMLASPSPEVRQRLGVLVRKFDVERLTAPTRVTLDLKNKTVSEALGAIAKQTGYAIETPEGDENGPRHDFAFAGTPFWAAVDQVATVADGRVTRDRARAGRRFRFEPEEVCDRVAYVGPFRFEVTQIDVERTVRSSRYSRRRPEDLKRAVTRVHVALEAEPKTPILATGGAELVRAEDSTGAPLTLATGDGPAALQVVGSDGDFALELSAPAREATAIGVLKGRVNLVLAAGRVPDAIIENPLGARGKTAIGRAFEIDLGESRPDEAKRNGYAIDLTLRDRGPDRDGGERGSGHGSNRGASVWELLELRDAQGNAYETVPFDVNEDDGVFTGTARFVPPARRGPGRPKLGPPATLVVHRWQTVNHAVEFEFKDLPLP